MTSPAERETCEWKQEDDWDSSANWETSCGHVACFEEGTPEEHEFKFCHWCGKPLVQILAKDETDDE